MNIAISVSNLTARVVVPIAAAQKGGLDDSRIMKRPRTSGAVAAVNAGRAEELLEPVGRIEEQGTPAELFGDPQKERTQQFLSAVREAV
ncbi:hypothetical protein [Phaeobacter inhibens]|uniref:hypothetical protein n=1 Tax=Phaeobacter inhibens TaxID=221822 RepID=UPI000CA3AFC4|nr:histidine transport ATP-binding protein HisP [Phaeobacter inhibens]